MEIKEIIVVEGKNDTKALQRALKNVTTIETSGYGLSKQTIQYIAEVSKTRGIILFLDPDTVGERIRRMINAAVPNCKNAFLLKEKARTSKKVGIEHASNEDIIEALKSLLTYGESKETLSWQDFVDLKLTGLQDSHDKREKVSECYSIGKCNSKTMFKRLNMLGVTKIEIEKKLYE